MLTPQQTTATSTKGKSQNEEKSYLDYEKLGEIEAILGKKPDETREEFYKRTSSKEYEEENRRQTEEIKALLDDSMTEEEEKLWRDVD